MTFLQCMRKRGENNAKRHQFVLSIEHQRHIFRDGEAKILIDISLYLFLTQGHHPIKMAVSLFEQSENVMGVGQKIILGFGW